MTWDVEPPFCRFFEASEFAPFTSHRACESLSPTSRRGGCADGAGALEQFAQAGREGAVAGVDGVLGIADEVGEAT
jgi:hypothetical protein